MASKRLTVPLCDIMLYVNDCLAENNLPSAVEMKRIRPKKREREELEERVQSKEESNDEDEEHSSFKGNQESEYKDEKDNSFKENQGKSESEEENSFKHNQKNKLSEYEKMVQKNREERMAFLQSLKIDEIKKEITKFAKVKAPRPKQPKNVAPQTLRKSRRLAKLDIDLSEKAMFDKALAEASRKNETEAIHRSSFHTNLKYSESSDLMNARDVKIPSEYTFEEAISVKDDLSTFIDTFDFRVGDEAKFISDYEPNFKNMKIEESGVAKVVPTRITCLTVHPSPDKIMVVAGSKYGHLGFWNVTSNLNPVLFLPHTEGVTNLKVNPCNPLQIISSSYDGTLRCGDMEKQSFNEIYNVSTETSCTYFDFISATTLLVSQRNGNVSVLDIRNKSSEKKHECHEYSVKTVHVHPGNKNMFLTADSKGIMKLWDLRKLQKKPIIDICHHRRSISSAFFSSATGKYILTTSADDSLCIFDSSNLKEEILFKKSIKHNNFTGRWLSPFKATWLPNCDDLFSVGSMNYPRRIEIYNANGYKVFNFIDEDYLNSVTSVNEFHPSLNVLAGGNSSGKIFIFADTK